MLLANALTDVRASHKSLSQLWNILCGMGRNSCISCPRAEALGSARWAFRSLLRHSQVAASKSQQNTPGSSIANEHKIFVAATATYINGVWKFLPYILYFK